MFAARQGAGHSCGYNKEMNALFLIGFGSALNLIGTFGYIRDTITGKVRPNRISWSLWSVPPLIAAVAAFVNQPSWAVVPIFLTGAGSTAVVFASFLAPNARGGFDKFDLCCGLCSAFALTFWITTDVPAVAVMFAILGDAFAALPTLKKAYLNPRSESYLVYATGIVSAMASVATAPSWTIAERGFPIYLAAMNVSIVFLLSRKFASDRWPLNAT